MKIKNALLEKKLREADETEAPVEEKDLDGLDPQDASATELGQGLKGEIEQMSDGEQTMDDSQAKVAGQEMKQAAEEVNAGQVAFVPTQEDFNLIKIENRLTKYLDKQLRNAKRFMRSGIKAGANVLIEGLPGSGKTAIVESWCAANGLICVAVNATDPKLETAINGMPLRDITKTDQNAVTIARSDLLAKLMDPANEGKCVLFVDEFNRQKDQQLRRVFLSLFNEKRNADGSLNFTKTLLFSVVCINPAGAKYHDRGTDQLNQAERSRFVTDLSDFDSNAEDAKAFFKGNIQKRLLALGVIAPDSEVAKKYKRSGPYKELSKEDLDDIDVELKVYDLARTIVDDANHPFVEFTFDTRDDLADINDFNRQLFNSRKLTDLLYNAEGDKEDFLDRVDNQSNMLDKTKDMLHEIVDSYVCDIKALRKEFGITADNSAAAKDAEDAAAAAEAEANAEQEDDADLWQQGSSSGSSMTPNEVSDIVNGYSW